jgi:serine/threonine protein kinase
VYRGTQPRLKRDVVIKVFREHGPSNDGSRERFLREAQIASRLHHPYAAHIYASGVESDGLIWIAMELVEGVTLEAWLQRHGRMPLEQFVPFFECVTEVVQVAHKREIAHRDLKPSNVMVIECEERLLPSCSISGSRRRATKSHRVSPPLRPWTRKVSRARCPTSTPSRKRKRKRKIGA